MSLLGYPGLCSATSHRNHCYLPVTPSVAVCSSDVNPAFGHYLPSSYQGNLWLLDHCQDSYCEVPCCESSNHELKTCTATCDPRNSCVPCNSPSATQVVSAGETTNIRSRPSCSPNTGTKRARQTKEELREALSSAVPSGANFLKKLQIAVIAMWRLHPFVKHKGPSTVVKPAGGPQATSLKCFPRHKPPSGDPISQLKTLNAIIRDHHLCHDYRLQRPETETFTETNGTQKVKHCEGMSCHSISATELSERQ